MHCLLVPTKLAQESFIHLGTIQQMNGMCDGMWWNRTINIRSRSRSTRYFDGMNYQYFDAYMWMGTGARYFDGINLYKSITTAVGLPRSLCGFWATFRGKRGPKCFLDWSHSLSIPKLSRRKGPSNWTVSCISLQTDHQNGILRGNTIWDIPWLRSTSTTQTQSQLERPLRAVHLSDLISKNWGNLGLAV